MHERGYPPSVREIGEAVGLTSPSTVHNHLATLQRLGYLRRDPTKPRAIEVRFDPRVGAQVERRPVRHVPLVGDVAAGTDVLAQENVEELLPLPADFTGDGELFMLRVRGDSMIDAGILDGDFVVCRQAGRRPRTATSSSPASPARRRRSRPSSARTAQVTLVPANSTARADGVRRRRGRDLRQGRHGAAPLLTAAAQTPFVKRSSSAANVRSIGAAVDALVLHVGDGRVAGTEVGRRDPEAGEAGDVGPAELGPHRRARCGSISAAITGWPSAGAAPSARIDDLELVAVVEHRLRGARARAASPRRRCDRARSDG